MKIIVRLYKRNKLIKRLVANRGKWRKVYAKIASAGRQTRFYERVEYGIDRDVFGRKEMFCNEYEGDDQQEAKNALKAFLEI